MPFSSRRGYSVLQSLQNEQRRRRFVWETLEARKMLAFDLWCESPFAMDGMLDEGVATSEAVAPTMPGSTKRIEAVDAAPVDVQLNVDGTNLEISIRNDRVVLLQSEARQIDPSLVDALGLRYVRSIDDEYAVYEYFDSVFSETDESIDWSALTSHAIPVFSIKGSAADAVLLDEIVVALKEGISSSDYFAGEPRFASYRPLPGTSNQFIGTVAAGKGLAALELASELASDGHLEWVSPNFYQDWQKFFMPNDPRLGNQWHLNNTGQSGGLADADSDVTEAWDTIQGGASTITIGIIDDGVAINHPDLNAWVNPGEIAGNGLDDDGNGWVDDVNGWNFVNDNNISYPNTSADAHGTSVSGVAAARGNNGVGVAGVSYNTPLLSARIFVGTTIASDANIASALYYAAGRKASGIGSWKAADVINNSWGGGSSSALVNAALNWGTTQGRQGKGATFFFATGNAFGNVGEPALQSLNFPGVIAVGATNNLGTLSDYSNNGPALDIVAPSNDSRSGYLAIDTTDRIGADGYSPEDYTGTGATGFGGTSSATPVATGIGALVLARAEALNIPLTPSDMRNLLRSSTDLIDGVNQAYDTVTGKNLLYGYGRLNAATAVSGVGKAEISVVSARQEFVSGASSISFGNVYVGETSDITFRVRNQGTSQLSLTGLTVSGQFYVLSGLTSTVLGIGGSASFTIRVQPQSPGPMSGTVTVSSSDLDEAAFTFSVVAIAITASIGGSVFEDGNGDGLKETYEISTVTAQTVYVDANNSSVFERNLGTLNVSQNTSVPIPDITTVTSTVAVSGATYFVSDINLTLNITHTFLSDLKISLVSPTGRTVVLVDRVGQNGANFTNTVLDDEAANSVASGVAPFTASFRPSEPLANFNGESPNGTWTLIVADTAAEDIGTLNNWSMQFTTGEQSTITQSNGYYRFVGLPIGSYIIRPVVSSGFSGTGLGVHTVNIGSASDNFANRDFGVGRNNRFYGPVFNDLNGDGTWDPSEQPAPGRTLYWDQNNNGIYEPIVSNAFPSGNVNIFVPDTSTRTSTINVSGLNGLISDVNVKVNITMPFVSDLDVFLIHPDGTRVELFTDVGGGGDNFADTVLDDQASLSIVSGSAPFIGNYRPEGRLSTLNGKLADGLWQLEVTDDSLSDQGTLNSWELIFVRSEPSSITSNIGVPFFDLPNSSQTIRLAGLSGWIFTQPTDGSRTVTASGVPLFDQRFGTKAPPFLAASNSNVVGIEGVPVNNSGTWSDADTPASGVSLIASAGTVVKASDGTWTWSVTHGEQQTSTQVTITAADGTGSTALATFTYVVNNAAPTVTRSSAAVSGNVLTVLSNTGSYSDVAADTVTLSASMGNLVNNGNGTWSWTMIPSSRLTNQLVTITASDEDGGMSTTSFTVDAWVAVANRQVLYRGSAFESIGGIDAALETTKSLLRATSTSQSTSIDNIVNWERGINAVVLDVAGLVSNTLTASDFSFRVAPVGASGQVTPNTWLNAPIPASINVIPGTSSTPARVFLDWPANAIMNTWLQIIVNANSNTGLLNREVFYIGHAMADVSGASTYRVTAVDLSAVQSAISTAIVSASDPRDFNKDRRVTAFDLSFVQSRVATTVLLSDIVVPAAGSAGEGESQQRNSAEISSQTDYFDKYFSELVFEDPVTFGGRDQ
ncbi:MAG: S8 family serine peptidase [Pirellula sp.]